MPTSQVVLRERCDDSGTLTSRRRFLLGATATSGWGIPPLARVARLAAFATLVLWSVQVQAAPIEFTFSGVVDSVSGIRPPPWNTVNVGDPWSITYRFESATPDSHAPTTLGEYLAIDSYSLTIGSANETNLIAPASTFIRVFNSQPAGFDQYEVFIPVVAPSATWFMQLDTTDDTVFSTDALKLCGDIVLADFNSLKDFTLGTFGGPGVWDIHGSVLAHSCACVEPPTGMVAWYTGDDCGPSDFLGQHHGAFVGFPVCVFDWKVGGGTIETHAPDTYVIVPDGPGILGFGNPGQNFSIDAWIKVSPGAVIRPIVDKRVQIGNSVSGYAFFLTNNLLSFQMADDVVANPICDPGPIPTATSSCTNYVSSANVTDGVWHHVAVTVDRQATPLQQVVLYLNGVAFPMGMARGNTNNNAALLIGSGYPIVIAQTYLTGLIDELEIFGRALTQAEVQAIYLADSAGKCKCAPLPSNMVAWWPLDELTGGTATDIVGGRIGTHVNGPTPLAGQYVDNSLCFNGASLVDVPSAGLNVGAGNFSIDAWVRRDLLSTNSPPSVIVDKRDSGNGVGYSLSVSFGRLIFSMSGTNFATISSPVPADGLWHFVAVTVDRAGVGQFYADCNPLDTFIPLLNNLDNTNVFRIGAGLVAGNQPWLGCIDELELFTSALTLQEIQSICNAGSTGKCKCAPRAAPAPYDRRKNRYITFAPCNRGETVAFRVQKTALPAGSGFCSVNGVSCTGAPLQGSCPSGLCVAPHQGGSPGGTCWVQTPVAFGNDIYTATCGANPVFRVWTEPVIHVGDCETIPVADYTIFVNYPGLIENPLGLAVSTILLPYINNKLWADNVGSNNGTEWTPPNQIGNVNDILSLLAFISGAAIRPQFTVANMQSISSADSCLNAVVNTSDVLIVVQALAGASYGPPSTAKFTNPAQCAVPPTVGCPCCGN